MACHGNRRRGRSNLLLRARSERGQLVSAPAAQCQRTGHAHLTWSGGRDSAEVHPCLILDIAWSLACARISLLGNGTGHTAAAPNKGSGWARFKYGCRDPCAPPALHTPPGIPLFTVQGGPHRWRRGSNTCNALEPDLSRHVPIGSQRSGGCAARRARCETLDANRIQAC